MNAVSIQTIFIISVVVGAGLMCGGSAMFTVCYYLTKACEAVIARVKS